MTGGNLPRIQDRDKSCLCNKFASFLRTHVCRRPEDKALLIGGHIVVALCPTDAPACGRAAVAELEHPLFERDHNTIWLHIGLQYLSPFRPTFQTLVPSSAPAIVHGGVPLRATNTFSTWHNQFGDWELEQMCWAGLFRLWEGEVPIAEVVPAEVCVHRLRKPVLFWLGSLRRTRAPRAAAAAISGPSVVCDEDPLALEGGQEEGDASGGEELLDEGEPAISGEGAEPLEKLEVLLARLFSEVVEAPPEAVPEGFAPEGSKRLTAPGASSASAARSAQAKKRKKETKQPAHDDDDDVDAPLTAALGQTWSCDACGTSSASEVEWAHYATVAPGQHQPHGPKCKACVDLHQDAFAHFHWTAFVAHTHTEKGAREVHQAKARMSGAGPAPSTRIGKRSGPSDGVFQELSMEVDTSRTVIVLNEHEDKSIAKKNPPGGRGPRVPHMLVPSETDPTQSVKVWVFADPLRPHRQATISTRLGNPKATRLVDYDGNKFEAQGAQAFGASVKQRVSELLEDAAEDDQAAIRFGHLPSLKFVPLASAAVPSFGTATSPKTPGSDATHAKPATSEQAFRSGARASADLVPADSVSQAVDDDDDENSDDSSEEEDTKITASVTSAEVWEQCKKKSPLRKVARGKKLGRQERTVKIDTRNGGLDRTDLKLLKAYLRLARLGCRSIWGVP